MKAQIVKVNQKTVVLKNEKCVFATVSKNKLDYKLGDVITLEKDGEEVYFLPMSAPSLHSKNDFWDDSNLVKEIEKDASVEDEGDGKAISGALLCIVFLLVGYYVAYYICCGAAIGCLIYSISKLSSAKSWKKGVAIVLIIIAVILLIGEISIASRNGL